MYFCPRLGGMAEWSNAAVLKTVEGHTSGGSNPSPSAIKPPKVADLWGFFHSPKTPSLLERFGGMKKPRTKRSEDRGVLLQVLPLGITQVIPL